MLGHWEVRAQASQGQPWGGGTGSGEHGRDRELGTLASSPASAWDAVTFLMSLRYREMKQEGEEKRSPSKMAQAEKVCQRCGETWGDPGGKEIPGSETKTLRDVDQKTLRD